MCGGCDIDLDKPQRCQRREQRTNNARTAYEQRVNYERELTRELRDAPLFFFSYETVFGFLFVAF